MATKKITELPLIQTISGSYSVVPIVIGNVVGSGTTDQITIENFSRFVTAYSAHTGSAGNTFTGPQTINNNVTINGKLTVTELVATYETASIIYSEGGNIFGNELIDKQQFTGSSNFTGSVFINGQDYTIYSSSNSTVFTNFSSSNSTVFTNFSSSNSTVFTNFSSSNSSYNTTFSSSNAAYVTAFSSSNSNYNTIFSSSNSSYNTIFSSSNSTTITAFLAGTNSELARVYQATASIQAQTASLLQFTASQDGRNFIISQYTSSTDAHIVGISAFTSSQLAVNLGNAIYTASVDSHIVGISTYTSSVRDTLARVHQTTESIQFQTASLLAFTASQDSRNFTLSQVTGSFRGEIGGLEAYSASLKAAAIVSSSTQVQNYDLFALNSNLYISTGSLIGITNGLMAFTASLDNAYATDAQLYPILQATRSLELLSGSLIGITNGLMALTASMKGQAIVSSSTQITNYYKFAETASANTFYGDQTITGSLLINDSATNFLIEGNIFSQTYLTSNGAMVLNPGFGGVEMVGSNRTFKATDITADGFVSGEIRATNGVISGSVQLPEIAGLEAYTASLKGAAIVSSSQQIKNYIEFVNNSVTSSMNVNSASIAYKATNVVGSAGRILFNNATDTTTTSANLAWDGSKLAVNGNISFGYASTLQSSNDPTNNISLHDGTFGEMRIRNGGTDRITLYRTTDTIKLSGSLVVDSNNPSSVHQITGSLNVTGSAHTIQNGYVILQQVSQSLNFVDDTAAASGGVPLGGLYRNGNFIVIRIV